MRFLSISNRLNIIVVCRLLVLDKILKSVCMYIYTNKRLWINNVRNKVIRIRQIFFSQSRQEEANWNNKQLDGYASSFLSSTLAFFCDYCVATKFFFRCFVIVFCILMKHNSNRICDYDFFLDLRRNKEKKERSIIIRASVVVYTVLYSLAFWIWTV